MQKFTILVVDDDPAIRNLLGQLLNSKPDYRVVLAGDSKEAVCAFYEERRIDVVLTDIHMPDHTGIEMMSDMKTIDYKPEILVMTANGTPENVEKARKIGARSLILKPFDNLEVIEAEISKAIEAVAERRAAEPQAPAAAPTDEPTGEPAEPAAKPTAEPAKLTAKPTAKPTAEPAKLTAKPTAKPAKPTAKPTAEPAKLTAKPTAKPTAEPAKLTAKPTAKPAKLTAKPTAKPAKPTAEPAKLTAKPTAEQPAKLTAKPTAKPAKDKRIPPPRPPETIAAEDAETAAEETALEIPAELESIFHVGTDLDAAGLKLQVPIVCLQTWEEQDAIIALRRLAGELGRKLHVWSSSRGIVDGAGKVLEQTSVDPMRALGFIGRQGGHDTMFLLADFGRCLEDPQIVRTLRELVIGGHTARVMVALTAPRMIIRPELEGCCDVFEWPASKRHITVVFDEVWKAVESSAGRPISLDADACEKIFERLKGMPDGRVRFEMARALVMKTRA